MFFKQNFEQKTIIPVVNFSDLKQVEPVIEILNKNGFNIIEITLRNEISMDALALAVKKFEHAIIGAGTLKLKSQITQILDTGAKFAFTPGIIEEIIEHCIEKKFPLIPGIATPSDAVLVEKYGHEYVKLFPASILGGVDYMNALSKPFPNLKICPTGGVNQQNAKNYLALENCYAIGGSWLTPANMLNEQKWAELDVHVAATANV